MSPVARRRFLYGPDLRGFLGEAEIWLEILERAGTAGRPGDRERKGRALRTLFDRIAGTEHLATLVPEGRLDAGLARRAAGFARRRLRRGLQDLGTALLGARIACGPAGATARGRRAGPDRGAGGGIDLRLSLVADPEQGRPADRIDLGSVAGAAGALTIVVGGRRPLRSLSARFDGRVLIVRAAGRAPLVVPSPGSPLRDRRGPSDDLADGARRPATIRLAHRELVAGTSILLTPGVVSRRRRLIVMRPIPGLGDRLARALRIVRLAWPEGEREIRAQTRMVVPVRERGLVSYSLASRPGVSFINVHGKTTFDLADDLLHESAHHRLHAMQELTAYLAPGPETAEAQAFDSPWRGARRPLHGLLHGAYTFRFRAELLRRVLRAAARRPRLLLPLLHPRDRSWLRSELRRERAMLARALAGLRRASQDGLLTVEGKRLLRELRRPASLR